MHEWLRNKGPGPPLGAPNFLKAVRCVIECYHIGRPFIGEPVLSGGVSVTYVLRRTYGRWGRDNASQYCAAHSAYGPTHLKLSAIRTRKTPAPGGAHSVPEALGWNKPHTLQSYSKPVTRKWVLCAAFGLCQHTIKHTNESQQLELRSAGDSVP